MRGGRLCLAALACLAACARGEYPDGIHETDAVARRVFEALRWDDLRLLDVLLPTEDDLEWIQDQPGTSQDHDPAGLAFFVAASMPVFFKRARLEFDWSRATYGGLTRNLLGGKAVKSADVVFAVEADGGRYRVGMDLAVARRGWVIMDRFTFDGPGRKEPGRQQH